MVCADGFCFFLFVFWNNVSKKASFVGVSPESVVSLDLWSVSSSCVAKATPQGPEVFVRGLKRVEPGMQDMATRQKPRQKGREMGGNSGGERGARETETGGGMRRLDTPEYHEE